MLSEYNNAQITVMKAVKDELRWHLGVELGRDPRLEQKDKIELEVRFACWLIDGGGQWLRELPEIHSEYIKIRTNQ